MKLSRFQKGGVAMGLVIGFAFTTWYGIEVCRHLGCDNEFQNGYLMQTIAFSIPFWFALAVIGYLCATGIERLVRRH